MLHMNTLPKTTKYAILGSFSVFGLTAAKLCRAHSNVRHLFEKLQQVHSELHDRYCQIRCIALGVLQTPGGFLDFSVPSII